MHGAVVIIFQMKWSARRPRQALQASWERFPRGQQCLLPHKRQKMICVANSELQSPALMLLEQKALNRSLLTRCASSWLIERA